MIPEPDFLDVEEVLLIHDEQLAEFGGGTGIRDRGGLESAVAQAQASFGGEFVHTTIYEMAAAYAFHIAQNQPFVDGNKRTALVAALVFLDLNGIEVLDPEGHLYDAMIGFAERRQDNAGFAKLLEQLTT